MEHEECEMKGSLNGTLLNRQGDTMEHEECEMKGSLNGTLLPRGWPPLEAPCRHSYGGTPRFFSTFFTIFKGVYPLRHVVIKLSYKRIQRGGRTNGK